MNSASHKRNANASNELVPSFPVRALHLVTLCTFAVAQPLLDILARHAEFFSIRGSQPIDPFVLVFILILVVPLPFVVLTVAGEWLSERRRRDLQAIMVGLLIAVVLMPPLVGIDTLGGWVVLFIAFTLGVLSAIFYARFSTARGLLTFGSIALIAFPVLFLLNPAIEKITFPEEPVLEPATDVPSDTPVVLVVFDELPTSSLLNKEGAIDAELFPNFADLAEGSVWFRNATTVATATELALPAILSGMYPRRGLHPTFQDHPLNLFSLLDQNYHIEAAELTASLIPADPSEVPSVTERMRALLSDLRVVYLHLVLPPDWTGHLPPITQSWNNFASNEDTKPRRRSGKGGDLRAVSFLEFVDGISPAPRSLWFLHTMLPHGPHRFYPSGRSYTTSTFQPSREDLPGDIWSGDEWAVAQAYQRHLIQVALVDDLLGRLNTRLRETGLWDNAVIIVTSDHGISFRAGDGHRLPTDTNLADILSVPMFVRAPDLETPVVSDAPVQVIGILPTIADLLNIDLRWDVEGKSFFDASRERPGKPRFLRPGAMAHEALEMGMMGDIREQAVLQKFTLFGDSGPERLFQMGPYGQLVGRPLASFPPPATPTFRGRINNPKKFEQVVLDASVVPGEIVGVVERQSGIETPWIAISINGVIRAVTRSYERDNDQDEALWAAVVSETSFKPGKNSVELFTLNTESSGQVQLHTLEIAESSVDFRGKTLGISRIWGVKDSGFYSPGPAAPMRWTNGNGKLVVPVDPNDPPAQLTVNLVNWGPIEQPDLSIVVNGVILYSGPVTGGKWSKTVSLSAIARSARLNIQLLSDTQRPIDVIPGSNDKRPLGVQVSGVILN